MSKRNVLIQLDTDGQPSVFDAVVAIDAGVDLLLTRSNVDPRNVREMVFGAIFTRGPDDLRHTAIFVGGSDVAAGETVVAAIRKAFFGPLRVSIMVDSNGANTTAAAAVLAAAGHRPLSGSRALVLGGTGPVGQRVARLLVREGAKVFVASRNLARAQHVVEAIRGIVSAADLEAVEVANSQQASEALMGIEIVVAAGAAGVQLLSAEARKGCPTLKVAIDLNAVPPAGLEGIEPTDHGKMRDGAACYGAVGVGRTKMKIHKRAVQSLFEANNLVLDAEEIFAIGRQLTPAPAAQNP
jgi:hypothetical protein